MGLSQYGYGFAEAILVLFHARYMRGRGRAKNATPSTVTLTDKVLHLTVTWKSAHAALNLTCFDLLTNRIRSRVRNGPCSPTPPVRQ